MAEDLEGPIPPGKPSCGKKGKMDGQGVEEDHPQEEGGKGLQEGHEAAQEEVQSPVSQGEEGQGQGEGEGPKKPQGREGQGKGEPLQNEGQDGLSVADGLS